MSHQRHGLPQSVPLSWDEGLVFISQATRSGHHELSYLVIQAVERLDCCKGSKRVVTVEWKTQMFTPVDLSSTLLSDSGILWIGHVWFLSFAAIVLLRIIPLLERKGIIRLNPLPAHSLSTPLKDKINFYGALMSVLSAVRLSLLRQKNELLKPLCY